MKGVKFSSSEKKKIELIKKGKVFIKRFGFKPTKDFLKYKESDPSCNIVCLNRKKDLPFSDFDPKILNFEFNNEFSAEKILQFIEKKGVDVKNRDFYFFNYFGREKRSFITKKLLRASKEHIVHTIFHEYYHSNVNLPVHMNEAGADIAGTLGWCLFSGFSKRKISSYLTKEINNCAKPHNDCFKKLAEKYGLFVSDILNYDDYQLEKEKIVAKYGFPSFTYVCMIHSYCYYFPLLVRLVKSLDYDLQKFLEVMKKCPFKEPRCRRNRKKYFMETRKREKEMEKWIEKMILEKK